MHLSFNLTYISGAFRPISGISGAFLSTAFTHFHILYIVRFSQHSVRSARYIPCISSSFAILIANLCVFFIILHIFRCCLRPNPLYYAHSIPPHADTRQFHPDPRRSHRSLHILNVHFALLQRISFHHMPPAPLSCALIPAQQHRKRPPCTCTAACSRITRRSPYR